MRAECPSTILKGETMEVKGSALRIVTVGSMVAMTCFMLVILGAPASFAQAQDNKPHAEVYGFVQADYIQDFNRVDPAWTDTLRPSKIPTIDGLFGEDGQAYLSAKQSR